MIIMVIKEQINGRWANTDASKLYFIGQTIVMVNNKTYTVTKINGSKVTLEEQVNG